MIKTLKRVLACSLACALTIASVSVASAATSPVTSVEPEAKKNVTVSNVKVDTKANGTATIDSVAKTTKKSVTVPATVKVNGVKYAVTTIDAKAFSKCTKMTKVTLPASLKTINANAFKGAKALKTITFTGKKAVTLKKNAFKSLITSKMTIKVSKKMSSKEYKKFVKALRKAKFVGKIKRA